jgi:hypothetical protein
MNAALTKRNTIRALLLAAALVLCGCASISENTHACLGSPRLAPTNPGAIRIFAVEPDHPKERLGEIILSIYGNPSRQRLEDRIKTAAARLGAEGVFIVCDRVHAYPVMYWDSWFPVVVSDDFRRVVVGIAFRYK